MKCAVFLSFLARGLGSVSISGKQYNETNGEEDFRVMLRNLRLYGGRDSSAYYITETACHS